MTTFRQMQACPEPLFMWVIYKNPDDYVTFLKPPPGTDVFVLRKWEVLGSVCAPKELIGQPVVSLEQARSLLPPGCHCIGRQPDDMPTIVEVWV